MQSEVFPTCVVELTDGVSVERNHGAIALYIDNMAGRRAEERNYLNGEWGTAGRERVLY